MSSRLFPAARLVPGLILALIPMAVWAVPLTVVNHSFETPATPPGTFVTNAPPNGWSTFGSINFSGRVIGVVNPNDTTLYADLVPDGDNVGVTFLLPSFTNVEGGLQQTLVDTLQTQTEYTLTVEVGNMAVDATPPHNAFNFNGFPGYRIDLVAGSTVIASDNNTLLPGEGRFLTSTIHVSTGASHPNAGQALGIRLVNLDSAPGIEVNFDDVRLDAVPVPTQTPTVTLTTTPTQTVTVTPTNTPTNTPMDTPTVTPTETATPTGTMDPSPTAPPEPSTTPTPTETIPATCPATPPSCSKTPVAGRGTLAISSSSSSAARNSVRWTWKGQATSLAELGSPVTTDAYRVCLYDGVGTIFLDALAVVAPGSCNGKPCWKALNSGYRYRDRTGQSAGLTSLVLKAGADGRALVQVMAKGANVSMPDLPLPIAPAPVRAVVLREGTSTCWGAQFSTVVTDPTSATKWKARND